MGEGQYDPIYAPQRLGGEPGDEQVFLQQDSEDGQIVEGEFAANPNGTATVPYNQVFRSYANAAFQNLDTGYVPLSLRDIVRNYFTSLEPRN